MMTWQAIVLIMAAGKRSIRFMHGTCRRRAPSPRVRIWDLRQQHSRVNDSAVATRGDPSICWLARTSEVKMS